MRKHTELLRDPHAYVESIGKQIDIRKQANDRQNLLRALETNGRDAIVRLCFSVPHRYPPVRALGYFAAATHIVETYLPEAQLQFIATVHANERINHMPLNEAKAGAQLLFDTIAHTDSLTPGAATDVVYGFDMSTPPETPMHRIIPIMRHEEVSQALAKSAASRRACYTEYIGAHLALHDAINVVESATSYGSVPLGEADTLISIGAQQNEPSILRATFAKVPSFLHFQG